MRLSDMFTSGRVSAMVESCIRWLRFMVVLMVRPMFEKVFVMLTDDVRVLCVKLCGLYILVRLLRS